MGKPKPLQSKIIVRIKELKKVTNKQPSQKGRIAKGIPWENFCQKFSDKGLKLREEDLLWSCVLDFKCLEIKMFQPMWSMALQIWELLGLML